MLRWAFAARYCCVRRCDADNLSIGPFSGSEDKARPLSVFARLVAGGVSKGAERTGRASRGLLPFLVLAGGWYTPNKSDAGCADACSCGMASGHRAKQQGSGQATGPL